MCAEVRKSFSFSACFLALAWLSLFTPAPACPDNSSGIGNVQFSWNEELETLKEILHRQIDYAKSLRAELATRKISQDDYEKALQQLRESLQASERRIAGLETRLASSIESEKNLRRELEGLRRLLEELKKEHEKASSSLTAFKAEAEKQIREAREERDREASKKSMWQIVSVVLAVLAAVAAIL